MSFQMLDIANANPSVQSTIQSELPDCHRASNDHAQMGHGSSTPTSQTMTESDPPSCNSNADSMHNCCSATCVNVMAFTPSLNKVTHIETRLSKIESHTQGERVQRPQSLYRPPIA
ncbi:hypothetical protein AB4259_00980 [Vibrio amylolyticus]|uniref:hypothetical protein n=1 Tax=Vibrio TaxID=662 RepID=UPI0010557472|nr:hypothetical protein [Vibrio sp. 10N.261.55.A7]